MAAETEGKIVTTAAGTGDGSDVTTDAGTVSMPSDETVTMTATDSSGDSSGTERNRDRGSSGTADGTGTGTGAISGSTVPLGMPPQVRRPRGLRRLFDRNHGTDSSGSSSGSSSVEDDKAQKKRKLSRTTWIVIWALTAVTISVASTGQVDVWQWAGLDPTDPRRFALPAQTELAVIGWLLIGKLAHARGRSPYPWWFLAFAFAAGAVYLNIVHGTWKQGLIFGGASGATMAFLFAKFYLDFIGDDVDAKLRDGARPKVLGFGSLTQPRIDVRAFLIVRRRAQANTVERARELAELWIWIYQDTKAKLKQDKKAGIDKTGWHARRGIARRTAWMQVNIECGVKVIEPQGIKVAGVTFQTAPAPAPQPPAEMRVPQRWVDAEMVQQATPRPPAKRRPTNSPVSTPPATSGPHPDDATPEMFVANAARLDKVKDILPDWATRPDPYTVDEVVKLGGIGNRTNASHVAKCLRTLRRNMTTAQGGDLQ